MITITLNFQRRALFYTFNFVLPCLVISISCLAGFILPANKGEKIGLRKFNPLILHFFILLINYFKIRNNKFTWNYISKSKFSHNHTNKFIGSSTTKLVWFNLLYESNDYLTSNLLKIVIYLITVGLLCLLSLVLNAFVLYLSDHDVNFQKDMPKWVKIVNKYILLL